MQLVIWKFCMTFDCVWELRMKSLKVKGKPVRNGNSCSHCQPARATAPKHNLQLTTALMNLHICNVHTCPCMRTCPCMHACPHNALDVEPCALSITTTATSMTRYQIVHQTALLEETKELSASCAVANRIVVIDARLHMVTARACDC